MKKKAIILTFFTLLFHQTIYAELSNSGFAYLEIPASAQSAASMTVFSQSSQSPLSVFENPLGIKTDVTRFSFSHSFWFSDISIDALAFSVPLKKSSFAFGLNYVRIPGVEIRETPSDAPLSNIEPQYITAAAAYAWSPLQSLGVAVTAKYLYEHLYTHTDNGLAFDFAARWNLPSSLDLSAQLKNIGFLKSSVDENALPTTFNIGIVRPGILEGDNLNTTIGLNLGSNLVSKESYVEAGTEINYRNTLSLRGGFSHIGSFNKESIGFGIHLNNFTFDYAYLIMPEGLNNPHILTISYRP